MSALETQASQRIDRSLALPAGAASILLYQAVSLGLTIAASIPVARFLGPSEKGVINLFTLLTNLIAEFGLLGVNSGLLYFLANRRTPLPAVHAAALRAAFILGAAWFVAMILTLPILAEVFPGLPRHFLLSAGIIAPLLLYRPLWSTIMTGIDRAVQTYRIGAAFSALAFLGVLVLWGMGSMNAGSVIWLTVLLIVAFCAYAFAVLGDTHRFRFGAAQECLRGATKYGLVAYLGLVCNYLHLRIDQVLVNLYLGPRGVGIYTVSVAAAELLWLIDSAITNASLFRISSAEARMSWRLTFRLFSLTFGILVGVAILVASLADPAVRLLYGAEFHEAVWPLRLLLPGIIAWGSARLFSQFVSFNAGRPQLCTGAAFVSMFINVIGNIYMIPRWGLPGAAVMSSVSYLMNAGLVAAAFVWLGHRQTTQGPVEDLR